MTPITRRVIVGVLLVAAVVAVVVAFSGDDSGEGPTDVATPAATTPMWSVRRVPEPVVDAVGVQRLQGALDAAVPGAGTCFVVNSGNHTLATHGSDTPLIGASTQKLLVAAAALSILGPESTYQTRVVTAGEPVDGTVEQMWLVGGGDPVLATDEYRDIPADPGQDQRRRDDQPRHAGGQHRGRACGASPAASSPTTPATTASATSRRGRSRTTPTATSVRSVRSPSTTASALDAAARPWSTTRRSTPRARRACLPRPRRPGRCVTRPGVAPADSAPIAKISRRAAQPGHRVDAQLQRQPQRRDVHQGARRACVAKQGTTAAGDRGDHRQADRAGRGPRRGSGSPTAPGSTAATR